MNLSCTHSKYQCASLHMGCLSIGRTVKGSFAAVNRIKIG
jgi:hypothetical protein